MNFNYKILLIITICFITLLATVVFWGSIGDKTHVLNDAWINFTETEVKKINALSEIESNFGYGGFIHNFKNYVLRKNEHYRALTQRSLTMTYASIEHYAELELTALEAQSLSNFTNTVDKYKSMFKLAQDLVARELTSEQIDKQVKVPDDEAIEALKILTASLRDEELFIKNDSYRKVVEYLDFYQWGFLFIIAMLLVFSLLSIRYLLELTKQYKEKMVFFNLAPDGLIISDEEGKIIECNKKACEIFLIDEFKPYKYVIEDLVPVEYRAKHKQLRKDFMKPEHTVFRNAPGDNLFGLRLNGEKFPAAISISSYSTSEGKHSVAIVRDISVLKDLEQRSVTDPLTGLYNRQGCNELLKEVIYRNVRYSVPFSVILIDIDYFKKVNDKFGHLKGDEILKRIAAILLENIRRSDSVSRWGGEEFLVITPETNKFEANVMAESVRYIVEDECRNEPMPITISCGVAQYDHVNDDIDKLLIKADSALYASKRKGRNRVTVFDV